MLEKTLETPLDCKEIQPVHPKGNQSWVFIGRTDAEAETLILWPPDFLTSEPLGKYFESFTVYLKGTEKEFTIRGLLREML